MLEIMNLNVGYGDLQVLRDVSLNVAEGEIVSIVGSNGSGKTTLINTVSGLLKSSSGEIHFFGERIDYLPPHVIAGKGIAQVPEGRGIFPLMSVKENLEMGAYSHRARPLEADSLKRVFNLLPRLEERKYQLARTLSGGELQMLAIGRGLMANPQVMLIDEPSLGLAPILVKDVFKIIRQLNTEGTTILLVEQDVRRSLAMSDRGYVLENGRIVLKGTGEELLQGPEVKKAYLGL